MFLWCSILLELLVLTFTWRNTMIQIDNEKLKELWLDKTLSVRDVGRYFNLCDHTIRKKAQKLGLGRKFKTLVIEDFSDQKFGRLSPIKFCGISEKGKHLWLCKCDCGNEKIIISSSFTRGLTNSCGCLKIEKARQNGYELISYTFWKRLIQNAAYRELNFNITIEQAWDLYVKQNGKCAISGVPIIIFPDSNQEKKQTASPDRINSDLGYTLENFQWVHKRVNRLKNILLDDELLFWCRTITKNNIDKVIDESKYDVSKLTWE